MAGDVPSEMAKNFYCGFSCERILEYGTDFISSTFLQENFCDLFVNVHLVILLLLNIPSGSHRYPLSARAENDCLQR